MAKGFVESTELVQAANEVITEKKMDHLNNVSIKYVFVVPDISKTCPAKIQKASKELEYFGKFDFLVKISKKVWDAVNDETRKIILQHCLSHILVYEEDGITYTKITKHNVSEFASIITEYGIEWVKDLKVVMGSLYELNAKEIDSITL